MSEQQQGNGQQGRKRRRGRGSARRRKPDLWRDVPALDEAPPIVPTADPTALLRSLGPPPLQRPAGLADYYLATVVSRAAGVAAALAATAGVLTEADAEG
jgi:hypothetical protein